MLNAASLSLKRLDTHPHGSPVYSSVTWPSAHIRLFNHSVCVPQASRSKPAELFNLLTARCNLINGCKWQSAALPNGIHTSLGCRRSAPPETGCRSGSRSAFWPGTSERFLARNPGKPRCGCDEGRRRYPRLSEWDGIWRTDRIRVTMTFPSDFRLGSR